MSAFDGQVRGRITPMNRRQDVVHRDPEIMSGALVFVGTRVPVYNLFDYLEAGDSLDKFLSSFPSVTREQAIAALELAKEAVAGVRITSDDQGCHQGS